MEEIDESTVGRGASLYDIDSMIRSAHDTISSYGSIEMQDQLVSDGCEDGLKVIRVYLHDMYNNIVYDRLSEYRIYSILNHKMPTVVHRYIYHHILSYDYHTNILYNNMMNTYIYHMYDVYDSVCVYDIDDSMYTYDTICMHDDVYCRCTYLLYR